MAQPVIKMLVSNLYSSELIMLMKSGILQLLSNL